MSATEAAVPRLCTYHTTDQGRLQYKSGVKTWQVFVSLLMRGWVFYPASALNSEPRPRRAGAQKPGYSDPEWPGLVMLRIAGMPYGCCKVECRDGAMHVLACVAPMPRDFAAALGMPRAT